MKRRAAFENMRTHPITTRYYSVTYYHENFSRDASGKDTWLIHVIDGVQINSVCARSVSEMIHRAKHVNNKENTCPKITFSTSYPT